ncbi:hypothetical protein EDB81DRAFT_753939 [Dactylonectria macrodidyma]|uniref:Uncharacterized protein n=1 Tax=Dactylonectria macrodidyma TaxID=307937 RepID=A0A9P9JFF0_9HYPO|nr:hypothetical protein EDB81DRAFT_753939 [Dactylonectria macrodidyma]
MSSSRAPTDTLGRGDASYHQGLHTNHEAVPDHVSSEILDGTSDGAPPNRLIIAVDFSTTYSAVSYVAVPQGSSGDSIDPRSIRSIRNFPDSWNFTSNNQMLLDVPTEVMYPLDRHFRDQESLDAMNQDSENGDGDIYRDFFDYNFGINHDNRTWQGGDDDMNLFIVSESEAAAAHMLTAEGGLMLITAATHNPQGGGTVNANTYEISNEAPLRLSREVVPPGGGLHGSSYLNQSFQTHLQQLLADETYLEQGTETIKGIVEKIMIDQFGYWIKRSFDCYKAEGYKQFAVSGLRDNPRKGFRRGSISIQVNKIRDIFRERLEGIGSIMESQITAAIQRGSKDEIPQAPTFSRQTCTQAITIGATGRG